MNKSTINKDVLELINAILEEYHVTKIMFRHKDFWIASNDYCVTKEIHPRRVYCLLKGGAISASNLPFLYQNQYTFCNRNMGEIMEQYEAHEDKKATAIGVVAQVFNPLTKRYDNRLYIYEK